MVDERTVADWLMRRLAAPGTYRVTVRGPAGGKPVDWTVTQESAGSPFPVALERIVMGLTIVLVGLAAVIFFWLWIPSWTIGWLAEKAGKRKSHAKAQSR